MQISLFTATAFLLFYGIGSIAQAQQATFPNKAIKFIVPFPPLARSLAATTSVPGSV